MKHITENGRCTIWTTRTYQKSKDGLEHSHMLGTDDVHVLVIELRPSSIRGRKRNRVRLHVRLWKNHTPNIQIEKIEKVSSEEMDHQQLLVDAGQYLGLWQQSIYRHFHP